MAMAVLFATLSFAKKFPLIAASIVPAATGSVDLGKDRNGNTELKLNVDHLAKPASLTPPQNNYVVWVQEKDAAAENVGELKVNGKLKGAFQTVTPRRKFDVFVTAESDVTIKAPSGPEVLRGTVSR